VGFKFLRLSWLRCEIKWLKWYSSYMPKVDTPEHIAYSEHLLSMGTATAIDADRLVANAFQDIPQVESVYIVHRDSNVLRIFTVVNDEDPAAYDKIYDKEIELEDTYQFLRFDFNVITRRNRPVQDFIGQNSPAWERVERCVGNVVPSH
jgi:hypothetical protein